MASRQLDEEAIFHTARKIDNIEARNEYLDQICGGERGLRERVENLLKVQDEEQGFLQSSSDPGPTVDQPPITERPGTTIGRYKLLDKLGEGGMGTVFMAEQLRPVKRRVAVKIIKQGMDTQQFVARFEAERQALALMDHPNIARVLDAGCTETGRPYFVMELVKGVPITQFCDENCLTARQRVELFVSVCHAVQHAHQKGIIHRDLKPSNVLVALYDDRPVPKIIDFGVAKATNQQLTERTLFTQVGQIVGTWEYMSPEQAVLNQLDVDTRTDVYALGVILYELLTGVTPLDPKRLWSAALEETLRLIREEDPPKPSNRISSLGETASATAAYRGTDVSSLAKTIRGDMDWIVMKALEKDRCRRYETANAMAADLNHYLSGEAIEARPPSTVYRLKKAALRHRVALATTLLVALSLLAGIVSSSWLAVHWKQAMERAVLGEQKAKEALSSLHDELRDASMTAVMSGDEERARMAIEKARDVGLSESWLGILRGQLALYSGRPDEAIRFLKPQAQRSVAAESMLAQAYFYSGRLEESAFTVMSLSRRPPETVEDYLFTGQAMSVYEFEEGVRRIRVALNKRNSPLAKMILAHALAHIALDTGDSKVIGSALREAEAARCFLGDTPIMLSTHLFVRHVAIKIGHLKLSDDLLKEARAMSQELSGLPFGRLELVWFLEDFGDYGAADRIWGEVEHVSGYEAITYMSCLLRSMPPDKVLDLVDRRFDPSDLYIQCNKAGLMALIPDKHGEAHRICEEELRRPGSYDVRGVFLCVLLLLGHPDEAQTLGQSLMATSQYPFRYQKEVMQYTAGEISAEQWLRGAGDSRVNQSAAFMQVAMMELGNGNREEARTYFQKCVDVGLFVDGNYWWAKRYLEIMEADPNWPSWIKPITQEQP